jgi:hypothetical protein
LAKPSEELKKELEEELKKIWITCPDEIKRFHYGIITHSDAGKHSLEQYFGHMVHAYSGYYGYSASIGGVINLVMDPDFTLAQAKKIFTTNMMNSEFLAEYGGQQLQWKYTQAVINVWDTIESKEELFGLLNAYWVYMSRLYWWFHWYFPWGIGASLCHRRSPEDIKEIARLSQTS